MSFSYASTEFLLYSYAGIITRILSINFFIRPVNRIRQSDSTKKEKCRRRNSQMERIVFFQKKHTKKLPPLFRKSARKRGICAFQKTAETVTAPFFEKVLQKEIFANVAIRNMSAPFFEKVREKDEGRGTFDCSSPFQKITIVKTDTPNGLDTSSSRKARILRRECTFRT